MRNLLHCAGVALFFGTCLLLDQAGHIGKIIFEALLSW